MVPAGSVLSFELRGTAGGWVPTTLDALRSDLVNYLSSYVTVQALTVQNEGSFYEQLEWQFISRVTVVTWEAYGKPEDVASIVAHAVYEATGNLPSVGTIGSQGASTPGAGLASSVSDAIKSVGDTLGQTVANLLKPSVDEAKSAVMPVLVLVAVVAVVLVVSVGGKTTRVGLS